jgi:hypothetical protein
MFAFSKSACDCCSALSIDGRTVKGGMVGSFEIDGLLFQSLLRATANIVFEIESC